MIQPTNIIVTQEQASNNGVFILTGVSDDMEYVDGKSTGRRLGTRYSVVAPSNRYAALSIKIADRKPIISQEEIDQYGQPIIVSFTNFQGKFYFSKQQGGYGFTSRADSIEIVK